MSFFKCKMCGGTLEINKDESVALCQYCGIKQTLPKLDSDLKANLYDRANHFRRNNDYDKAMSLYEQILNNDNTDAESYWSIILCRYGIDYVEDPITHKRIPTVNRTQYISIYDDEDYKSALRYADEYQREIYESEAAQINEIQKRIIDIAQKESPFDVFICYKETDNNGRRTPDSVLATELYHELTKEGFKVFFSRITLEDKLGEEYEPYIFAALNSAKALVVLGTRPEYFNAVWVKNEWSRYLALIKNGAKKILIPAYRDMNPYDLPDEFSHLQAQDMSKLGFMQDLIHGIKKIVNADTQKTAKEMVIVNTGNTNIAPLLKRAFMFLEDGEWNRADDFFEQVLNQDPENAQAYLGKLMAELKVRKQISLKDCKEPFDDRNNYQKAIRFADPTLSVTLKEYITYINERNENQRLTGIYNGAVNAMHCADTERAYKSVAATFRTISEFKDADTLREQCIKEADICRINTERKAEESRKNIEIRKAKIKKYCKILFLVTLVFMVITIVATLPHHTKKMNEQAEGISTKLQGMVFEGSYKSNSKTYYDSYSFSSGFKGSRNADWPSSDKKVYTYDWKVKSTIFGKNKVICTGTTYEYKFTVKTDADGTPISIRDDSGHIYFPSKKSEESIKTNESSNSISSQYSTGNTHKPNLNWVPVDDTPYDNEYEFYKLELEGEDRNKHYLLKINTDDNTIKGSITLYKNEWSQYEGGRISGRMLSEQQIEWSNKDKTAGKFDMYSSSYKFEILKNTLTITAIKNDNNNNLAGTYKKAK